MQWFALTFQMEIAILSLQNDIHNCCLWKTSNSQNYGFVDVNILCD
jgi:hypothetical protein